MMTFEHHNLCNLHNASRNLSAAIALNFFGSELSKKEILFDDFLMELQTIFNLNCSRKGSFGMFMQLNVGHLSRVLS